MSFFTADSLHDEGWLEACTGCGYTGLGEQAKQGPTRKLPNFIVKLIALFNVELRDLVPLLGQARNATSAKAQRLLGWKPRSWEDAVATSPIFSERVLCTSRLSVIEGFAGVV